MKSSRYIVSACLVGKPCRYDGGSKAHAGVMRFLRGKRYVALCPEMLAGWKSPRPPVEYHGGGADEVAEGKASIQDNRGRDRTRSLVKGILKALKEVVSSRAKEAILKEKSPSCGVKRVYRDGKLTRGQGLFTYWLRRNGFRVRSEESFEDKGGHGPSHP
jgi:uncharacterized protein YbbK (DUF523 family)